MGQGVVEGRLHRAGVTGGEVGRAGGGLAREGRRGWARKLHGNEGVPFPGSVGADVGQRVVLCGEVRAAALMEAGGASGAGESLVRGSSARRREGDSELACEPIKTA